MGAPTTSKEEKARIITLREESMPIKEMFRQIRYHKATVMHILASSRELPPGVIPPSKPCPGPSKKTSEGTDFMLKKKMIKNPIF